MGHTAMLNGLRTWKIFVALLISVGVITVPSQAQYTSGTIAGQVTDQAGGAIPGATVAVEDLTTQAVQTVKTQDSGSYSFPSLLPRTYKITVSAPGFSQEVTSITLGINQQMTQDFHLNVGHVNETITVTGSSDTVSPDRDNNTVSELVTETQLASLPSGSRNFLDLAILGTGAQPGGDLINYSNNGGSAQYFQTTGQQFIPAGQSVGHTSYLQDGVTNTQLFTQAANILPDMDTIQEFSVDTTGESAQFGEPGVINVITKSGANAFHGDAYDYLQNSALNANNWFNNLTGTPLGPERYNQFGGTVGGPILPRRVFFFFGYEGQRQVNDSNFAGRVFTPAERKGDFSDYLTGVPCGVNCTQQITIYDPSTYNPLTGAISPFPDNMISAVSPFAQEFLSFFPLPNSGILADGNNLHINLPSTNNLDQFLGKIDWNISDKDRAFGTYEHYNQPTISDSFVPNLFGNTFQRQGINVALEETHTFSSTLLNVARVGYNRSIFFNSQLGVGSQNWVKTFGFQNLNPALSQNSPPYVSITQCCTLGNPYAPQGATQNLVQFADELNLTRGNHTIKIGGEVNLIQLNGVWTLYNSGLLTFNGQYTSNHAANPSPGLGLADFELGYPNAAVGGEGSTTAAFRETDAAGYINDSWRAQPKLTFQLGFRYQYHSPPRDKEGHASIYDLATATSTPGTWNPNYLNLAPRFGVAFAVSPALTVRGGYGIYYTSTAYNLLQFLLANPPNYLSESLDFSLADPEPVSKLFPVFSAGSTVFAPDIVPKHNPTPYVQQWNVDIQRTLGSSILLDLGYVGNKGTDLSIRLNPNQAAPENPLDPTPIQSRRPYPNVGDVLAQEDTGIANYNSLQASVRKKYNAGLAFQVSYTWSKAMDLLSTDGGDLIDGHDPLLNYGPSDFDRTNVLTASYNYDLPFGRGKQLYNRDNIIGSYIIGGWQLNGITTYGTGLPFTVNAQDFSDTGSNHEIVANRVCNGSLPHPGVFDWFNTSCFLQPGLGTSGDSGRNILRQGSEKNWNLSLFKNIPLPERMTLQARGELFNAFNQHSFINPDTTVGDAKFGQMLSATGARVIQVALKLTF